MWRMPLSNSQDPEKKLTFNYDPRGTLLAQMYFFFFFLLPATSQTKWLMRQKKCKKASPHCRRLCAESWLSCINGGMFPSHTSGSYDQNRPSILLFPREGAKHLNSEHSEVKGSVWDLNGIKRVFTASEISPKLSRLYTAITRLL